MASLIDELILVLEKEKDAYQKMIPFSDSKTKAIIDNDLEALQAITEKEQDTADELTALERKREKVIINIGTVLNKDPKSLKLNILIKMLDKQPEEQRKLSIIYDELNSTLQRISQINGRNKELIQQSLEMIDFNINLIRSISAVPGGSAYTRGAAATDVAYGRSGQFDFKS